MQAPLRDGACLLLRSAATATLLLCGCGGGGDDPANAPPVAVASAGASAGTSLDEFCFTGRDSTDADGNVVAWQWDRQPSSSVPLEESLAESGATLCLRVQRMQPNDADPHLYAYTLTVTDDRGATDSAAVEAWVPENESQFQSISIDAGADQATEPGQTVTLSGAINAGEFPCNPNSCIWEQMLGPDVGAEVAGSCGAGTRFDASFVAPQPAEGEIFLGFRLTAFSSGEPDCESRGYVAVTVSPTP